MSNFYESISYNMPETELEISVKFCFLWYPYLIFAKKFVPKFAQFCKLWSQTRNKRIQNTKNVFNKFVLKFHFASSSNWDAPFGQKWSKSCYPAIHTNQATGLCLETDELLSDVFHDKQWRYSGITLVQYLVFTLQEKCVT